MDTSEIARALGNIEGSIKASKDESIRQFKSLQKSMDEIKSQHRDHESKGADHHTRLTNLESDRKWVFKVTAFICCIVTTFITYVMPKILTIVLKLNM